MRYLIAKKKDLGDGFFVRRVLPQIEARNVGPFVFLDHMGPLPIKTGAEIVVRPHPHIGLATVTYLYDGVITHRDSIGKVEDIRPFEVNWMTAGSGIVHSERSKLDPEFNILEGIQTWVALPKEFEETSPEFFHHEREELPTVSGGGWELRLIAGSFMGEVSPVKVYSPLFYADLEVEAGAEVELPVPAEQEAGIYVARGKADAEGKIVSVGDMAIYPKGGAVKFRAEETSRIVLLGGVPLSTPRHMYWNFVSSSLERIEQAKVDWKEDRFAHVPGETERIPLPEH
ncbi:pirin family protein [Leptospira selangorensis]|uniref:pirin family protein n=1 Tax=Leptospira selangorensis TaxID=2484982 RepID=UPI00108306B5|nr:pirin family protein [Leptospira selangorensis]TGK05941.1 pirin family protein [Leptospira selangorensis]